MSDHLSRAFTRWDRLTSGLKVFCFPDQAGLSSSGAHAVPQPKRSIMAERYTRSTAITAELAAGRRDQYEHRVQRLEHDESVKSINQRRLGPALSRRGAAETPVINNGRVRQVARRRGKNEIVKRLRQSPTLLLASVAVDTAKPLAVTRQTIRARMISRKGDQKRWRRSISWQRSQRWIVKPNLSCLDAPLSAGRRTKPIDSRLPLSRKE